MPIRKYAAIMLLLFMACKPAKKKETGNVVSLENFDGFVNNLTLLHVPTANVYIWDTITAQYMFMDSSVSFKQIHAVRIPTTNDFIPVLYNGETAEKEADTYILATYTKQGKLIQKTDLLSIVSARNGISLYGKLVLGSDSVIEVRRYYVGDDVAKNKSSIRRLLIQKDGHHSWINEKTETFQAFTANFPALKLPASFPETPKSNAYPQFDMNNGWYDLQNLLGFDFPKLRKVGKVTIPGNNYSMYLIKVAELTGEDYEGAIEDGLYLVTFDANGKEGGRMQVAGGEGEEGYYTSWKDFKIDSSGSMHMIEEASDGTEIGYSLSIGSFNTTMNKDIALEKDGSLSFTVTGLDMDLTHFVGDSAYKTNDRADTIENSYFELGNYPGVNMHIILHTWTEKSDYVYEIFTMDEHYKIVDAITLASKLAPGKQPDLHVKIEQDKLYIAPATKMKMNGQVKILLKDAFITVGADGKLTKNTADIAAAVAEAK
ncbi:hypothetical protein ACE38W_21690 [Chitinophaga sp. Hz27]|uniref:hypothetical protein n=1 Tax=Chitinophaga sp. Hz27 TaxID=3347169 RepID=UPI0035DB2860